MIRVFNSAVEGERMISLDEVNVVSINMDMYGKPYMLFEHKDYPLGALKADFDGDFWQCDLD
jgi:hypothetical protein|tara:strand:+ start:3559 stop:3744 length:186 start_codon:yes stop_codon:yes gene_type:complete